jgi:hypothetical protein
VEISDPIKIIEKSASWISALENPQPRISIAQLSTPESSSKGYV